ncbi:MAG: zf-HC2 domain-containing protein [Gemmatimonadota bacterium]|nr:zf-HC2 domain-containing protein [Gemmatimonadota bacterium]
MQAERIDCDVVMRQLWDYLDGELTATRMAAIAAHLKVCDRCLPQYNFERSFLDLLTRLRKPGPAPEGLRLRIMTALVNAGLRPVA